LTCANAFSAGDTLSPVPHLFVNRPRKHGLAGQQPGGRANLTWETVNTTVYLVGGVMFIWGSVLFFPEAESRSDRGAWVFFFASLLYIAVTAHDLLEVVRYRATLQRELTIWDRYEAWAALGYLVGSVLFAAGSLFFLTAVGWYAAGSWTFIIGGLLFVFGAVINVLEVIQAPDRRTLQLMNLTAITFVTGSLLFVVASVPYLFTLKSATDQRTVDAFLAFQYVIGSVLFLLGGVFNYRRARIVALPEGGGRPAEPAGHGES
jgi:hypothetical protein